jgi:hypothetical protein
MLDGRVSLAAAARGAANVVLSRETPRAQIIQSCKVTLDLLDLALQGGFAAGVHGVNHSSF